MGKSVDTIVKKEFEKLLDLLEVDHEVSVSQGEDEVCHVEINSSENALLIGRYGDTLSSLEHVVSLICAQKLDEYPRIMLEIGGYREEREEYLRGLAERMREEVLSTGEQKVLSDLKPWERRLIHLFFSEDEEVVTESQGEGRGRVLTIRKR